MSLANIEQKGVSVVICCFNSSQRIVPTIEHLSRQKNIDFPWEVILVDNNSTDGTANIAMATWKKSKSLCPFRIIREVRPGTMYARKKGIEMSNYRYLLYCDDDNWLHENYIKTAYDIISTDERISAVGGIGLLEFEQGLTPPAWIAENIKSFGGPQGKMDGDTTFDKGCLYTAGAILDRVWMNKLYTMGFESSLKGRDGKSLQAGEDTELTFGLKLIGSRLYYSSQMHFKHFMPRGRMDWEYLKKLTESFGFADFLISPYREHFKNLNSKPFIIMLFVRVMVLTKYFMLAGISLFTEGNGYSLKFYRSLGQMKACIFSYPTFLRNKKMVEKLSFTSKQRGREKI